MNSVFYSPTLPDSTSAVVAATTTPKFLIPIPRDVNYEQVCAFGKAAYLNDLKQNPEMLDWEFASVIFKLNRHPMWSLLQELHIT